jgi:hypothetical protein
MQSTSPGNVMDAHTAAAQSKQACRAPHLPGCDRKRVYSATRHRPLYSCSLSAQCKWNAREEQDQCRRATIGDYKGLQVTGGHCNVPRSCSNASWKMQEPGQECAPSVETRPVLCISGPTGVRHARFRFMMLI